MKKIIAFIRLVWTIIGVFLFYVFCIMEDPTVTAYKQEAEEKQAIIEQGMKKIPDDMKERLEKNETGKMVMAYMLGEYEERNPYISHSPELNSVMMIYTSSTLRFIVGCDTEKEEFYVDFYPLDSTQKKLTDFQRKQEFEKIMSVHDDIIFVVGMSGDNNKNAKTGKIELYDYAEQVSEQLNKTCSECHTKVSDIHEYKLSNVKFEQWRRRHIVEEATLRNDFFFNLRVKCS